MEELIHACPVIPGTANGELMVSSEPLSFWGGYDQKTGEIIDRRHPLSGLIAAGHVLALPFSRGSSTTTAVLLEAVRAKVAPLALLSTGIDNCFALAAIVANEIYGFKLPVLSLRQRDFDSLETGKRVMITDDGLIKHI